VIRTILVALDETPIAPRVLVAANEIAHRFDARMLLFRAVMVPPEFPAAAANAMPDDPLPDHLAEEGATEARRRQRAGDPGGADHRLRRPLAGHHRGGQPAERGSGRGGEPPLPLS
jgi:Universal stress protein family